MYTERRSWLQNVYTKIEIPGSCLYILDVPEWVDRGGITRSNVYERVAGVEQNNPKKFEKAKFATLVVAVLFGGLVTLMGAVYAQSLFFLVVGFILGKFAEKLLAAVRDYRLSLKLDRLHYSQVEYEQIKQERDSLRAMLSKQTLYGVAPYRPGERERPPAVGSYGAPARMDEAEYMWRGGYSE